MNDPFTLLDNTEINFVSGNHAVWAISRDRRVWFRNGIHGGGSGESEALARGVKWVGMVGEMSMISIGMSIFSLIIPSLHGVYLS